ncbi:MAG: glutamate 5-kinase [Chloroflexi bacterium]|nr:glutamate 5-kinase [Chloroflexota bacterium]
MARTSNGQPLCNRIVVKFGTNLLTAGTDHLDLEVMASLVGQIASLHRQGKEVILVSSGAIAAGRHRLGLKKEHRDIPFKQVLASVGQGHLMHAYEQLFGWHDIVVAQALLTRADLVDRAGYLNARNTLLALMELRVVCIVNENDVVAVEEIEDARFGDNDQLSAMVANLVDADLLVILSDIAGLYTADPHHDPGARLIPRVDHIDEAIERMAGGSVSGRGTGGMATKLEAAKLATASGISVVITQGREPRVLERLVGGEALGTLFAPSASRRESRERWLISGLCCAGQLVVDEGAVAALRRQKKSLLPAGIRQVKGSFQRGDVVDIVGAQGNRIACGIVSYSSGDIDRLKGAHSEDIVAVLGYEYGAEVVRRNNMVIL